MCSSSYELCCGPNSVVLNSIETDNDEKNVRDRLGDADGSMCLTGRVQRSENRPSRSMQRIDTRRLSDHRAARNRHVL